MSEESIFCLFLVALIAGITACLFFVTSCVKNDAAIDAEKERALIQGGYVQKYEPGNATPIWVKP